MTTQQFKWIDRDTAARDLLQLVYHAPPQIAEQAIKLLKAIRSPAIIPELKAMFLDGEYDVKRRRNIYEVICATPGNFDFSEFEPLIEKVFGKYLLLRHAIQLLKHHPDNFRWMLPHLKAANNGTQLHYYSAIIEFMPEIAAEHILKILSENEISFGKDFGFKIYKFGGEPFKFWLEKNLQNIIRSWLVDDLEYETEYWQRLNASTRRDSYLQKWPELRDALHNISLDWLLIQIAAQSPSDQRLIALRLIPYNPKSASELLIRLVDEKQIFLDLETARLLHQYGDETVQNWLGERWDELIYLCLVDSVCTGHEADKVRIVHVLEKWPDLKEALFQNAPAMIEEYKEKQSLYNLYGAAADYPSDDVIRQQSSWQTIESLHNDWFEPKNRLSDTFRHLYNRDYLTINCNDDIPPVAAKIYFFGTTITNDEISFWFPRLLLESGEVWRREWVSKTDRDHITFAYTPVRFEVAYALHNIHNAWVWELFIEAFLLNPKSSIMIYVHPIFENHMLRWISRMTDILSGVEPDLPDEEIPLHDRPWFCALVKQNPSEGVT